MTPVSKCLVAVQGDFDRHELVSEIVAIAGHSGSSVTLLGIIEPPPDDPETRAAISRLYEDTTDTQSGKLAELRAELEQEGIPVSVQQAAGKAYVEIIRAASAGGADLIIKPASSEDGHSQLLFGNTDMQLFRLSPVPVWIFKPTPANKLARIMIAVDLLAFDAEKSALAEKILRWGKAIAEMVGASLHILHVWDLHQEFSLRSQVGRQPVDDLLQALEQRHRQWLDDAIAQSGLDASRITVHFRKGAAAETIPSIARARKIDLLVMGTVGRTGIPGFFIGNTADSVLHTVDCSVLAIKPDGFRTPVKVQGQPSSAIE